MKLIAEKYRKLKPDIDLLSDEVVIAQAWKKTHSYMRSRNWYADTLALDISALGLESDAASWGKQLKGLKPIAPISLELVPAAKSEAWVIDATLGWVPKSFQEKEGKNERKEKPPIRPLAHLTVKDQTWASAIMLCLADGIETAQGDCSQKKGDSEFFKHRYKGMYSYGNRLICDWKDGDAWFRWGNAECYRKFFVDYQSFLKRPVVIGRSVAGGEIGSEQVYVVNLDISKFYDSIDRRILLKRLKEFNPDSTESNSNNFWIRAKQILNWKWDNDATTTAKSIGIQLGKGLPQGLVAAGFFANAYLISFDKEIGRSIGSSIGKKIKFTLHDYCRYVDDLRLVISIEGSVSLLELREEIAGWVNRMLEKHGSDILKLNEKKTQIINLDDLDNKGVFSERASRLQNEISGPTDRDSLDGIQGVLEGFLTIQTNHIPEPEKGSPDSTLIELARFDHDIRTDTLKRFAANRLELVIRNKRRLDLDLNDDAELVHTVDNESELLAKKLIWAWMQDPSLGLVLRKAFEIFPSPEIAEPILEALYQRSDIINENYSPITAAIADYILADIFRSSVDFQGMFQRYNYPSSSNPEGFLALVCRFAQKVIAKGKTPKFLERQALLLLAVMEKPVRISSGDDSIQYSLHAILAGMPIKLMRQRLALYEIAAQITGSTNTIAAQLIDDMKGSDKPTKEKIFDEYSKRGGEFWIYLWQRLKREKSYKRYFTKYQWAAPLASSSPSSNKQYLSKIIASDQNGFIHEAGFIKLAIALLDLIEGHSPEYELSPRNIKIKQTDKSSKQPWGEIWKPEVLGFECDRDNSITVKDPRFSVPHWVESSGDARTIYKLGTLLRATVVGTTDFTASRWKKSLISGYKGLRTGWFKRRMGMMHSPEALVGDYSTLSAWSSELLMICLQWPGFEASYLSYEKLTQISSVEELRSLLKERLKEVNDLYCYGSEMPALITDVQRPNADNKHGFRIVTIQQLLPRTSDFSTADPRLNSPKLRCRSRDHISRICSLTHKTLNASVTSNRKEAVSSADLIVFPEVGVHIEDIDILKRLADKTGAMILAGIIFTDIDEKLVNFARWIIPDYRESGRQWIIRDQGKEFPTEIEKNMGVSSHRPCQHIIKVHGFKDGPFRLSGSICYDATDLKLASDLKDKIDLFVIPSHNKDVSTFDTMASALHYHMYQHVAVVNKGEFGGSTIQAPYREQYHRLISHAHGSEQISINVADLDLAAFNRSHNKNFRAVKTEPAG